MSQASVNDAGSASEAVFHCIRSAGYCSSDPIHQVILQVSNRYVQVVAYRRSNRHARFGGFEMWTPWYGLN